MQKGMFKGLSLVYFSSSGICSGQANTQFPLAKEQSEQIFYLTYTLTSQMLPGLCRLPHYVK